MKKTIIIAVFLSVLFTQAQIKFPQKTMPTKGNVFTPNKSLLILKGSLGYWFNQHQKEYNSLTQAQKNGVSQYLNWTLEDYFTKFSVPVPNKKNGIPIWFRDLYCQTLPAKCQSTPPPPPSVVEVPLQVVGKYLTDGNGNNIMMRGVNVSPFKEGWDNDVDAVANAVASTKCNVVRLHWWSHLAGTPEPQTGTTYYTANDLDRAITTYSNKGILPIICLHDLTGKTDATQFKNIIETFWVRQDIVTVLLKHQNHLIINIANEWGPNYSTNQNNDSPNDVNTFLITYQTTINAIRAKGINAPLMIDADHYGDNEKIFTSNSWGKGKSNGQALIDADPKHNLLFSVHTYYWEFDGNAINANLDNSRFDNITNSNLPFVIGEMGNLIADGSSYTNYASFLTKANSKGIGYIAWGWYNDGTPKTLANYGMNITVNGNNLGDGITLPTAQAQNPWGWDIINDKTYGINYALPTTQKINFK